MRSRRSSALAWSPIFSRTRRSARSYCCPVSASAARADSTRDPAASARDFAAESAARCAESSTRKRTSSFATCSPSWTRISAIRPSTWQATFDWRWAMM
jgi:hypothetical protein